VASAYITTRRTKSGARYVVRWRLGGAFFPLVHGGSFKTMKLAKLRRDLVAGEIAAGRNPADLLAAIKDAPEPAARTFADVFDAFVESRVDVSTATKENYAAHRVRLVGQFGDRDPSALTWQDVQEVVSALSVKLSPLSVRQYVATLRTVLDFADVDPNPARDRRVKLPRADASIPSPPSASEVAAIVSNAPEKWRLAIRVLEQTGLRVGELGVIDWGDVDRANLRLRIRTGKTKAARRWVGVPLWLMEEIERTCPPDDRTSERRVFPGANRMAVGSAMRRACKVAGIASYSPHDLRHRYISVKIREGIPVTEVAAAVGHSKKSLTLDTYAHVLIDE
jgi:integrase